AVHHGNERELIRPHGHREVDERGTGVTFDVELDATTKRREPPGDVGDITGTDVPLVLARVDGDSGSACRETDVHGLQHARNLASARVAERGDLVDVDREPGHEINRARIARPRQFPRPTPGRWPDLRLRS